MKRPLLIAALLAVAPIAVGGAAKASPLQMFNVQTPSAGVINFSGTGTANFNQSLGTNNSFNVGSSTNLGVNSSASSTEDYESKGSATLNLAGTSRLQQTIGTATSAFNAQTAAESSSLAAATAAQTKADSSSYGDEWSNSWNDTYTQAAGWEYKEAGSFDDQGQEVTARNGSGALTGTSAAGYYKSNSTFGAADSFQSTDTWETESKSSWKSGWENTYKTEFTDAYKTAVASSTSATTLSGNTGTISGDFNTINKGVASSDLSAQTSNFEAAAKHSADEKYGSSYANSTFDWAGHTDNGTDVEMEAAYNAEYSSEYSDAYSQAYANANTALSTSSESKVTVTGIGVIADVNAANTSSFIASSDLLSNAPRDGNGNGNASAGANLSTSSYANQSNSTTANAFMQAFSGGGLGATTVKSAVADGNGQVDVTLTQTTTQDTTTSYNATTGVSEPTNTPQQ